MTNPPSTSRPAAFLDRDGVLNVDHNYVHRPEDLEWVPGARRAVARLNEQGFLVIVVTNQSGVGRGYYTEADVDRFHARLQADLAEDGAHIDAFYICPFHRDATVERYRHPDHPDRKPNPGMILRAAADWNVDLAGSFRVGDKNSDIEAARAAGVPGWLFEGGDLDAFIAARLPL